SAGEPAGVKLSAYGRDSAVELPCTSHLNVVDRQGRVVSMTSSIEDQFGSRMLVKGFLLNNQLTDFSFAPVDHGLPVANRVEARKRPRSSMSPTMVFDSKGQFLLATGSPGGSQIIGYVAQTLIALLDWKLDPQQAVSLPHYGNRNGATELEAGQGL
ncbi:gamma-glutamyltransferase, partial [Pseudomonas sp. MWU13-2860]